jgi:putative endonuclease
MQHFVYILHSPTLNKYYVGETAQLEKRLIQHNLGYGKFTKRGVPWVLIASFMVSNRTEGRKLESKIKKRGIKRFLHDNSK